MDVRKIKGKKIVGIYGLTEDSEHVQIDFSNNGLSLIFTHDQNCCEYVRLVEYHGNIKKGEILHDVIVKKEEASSTEDGYGTWTFIEVITNLGIITMRWLGESNGYYSEDCDIYIRENGRDHHIS